jgi:Domain of unknown function (DUF4365)
MVGAIAPNPHEGSRSEYLAQYIFASFGTAVAVPHHEDTGIDLYCTLTERIGQRAWPRTYFAVQVKSTMDPWPFNSTESVRWLVEYPLPLFLCVVDKSSTRIRLYHTSPRFYVWAMPPLPDHLELSPTTDGDGYCRAWQGGSSFSLSAPVLDASLQDLLDDDFHRNAWDVLHSWIDRDQENLQKIRARLYTFKVPYQYYTNSTEIWGALDGGINEAEDIAPAIAQMKESLAWISSQLFRKNDLLGATHCAMLLRHLSKDSYSGGLHDWKLQHTINALVCRSARYLYAGIDELNTMISRVLTKGSNEELLDHA